MNEKGIDFTKAVRRNGFGENHFPKVAIESVFSKDVTKVSPQCTTHLITRCFCGIIQQGGVPDGLKELLTDQLRWYLKVGWTCPPETELGRGTPPPSVVKLSRPSGTQYSNFVEKDLPVAYSPEDGVAYGCIYRADDKAINLVISQVETAGQVCLWMSRPPAATKKKAIRQLSSTGSSSAQFAELFLEEIVDEVIFGAASYDDDDQHTNDDEEEQQQRHQLSRYYREGREMMYRRQRWKDEWWFVRNPNCNFAALVSSLQRGVGLYTFMDKWEVNNNAAYGLQDVHEWNNFARLANVFECADLAKGDGAHLCHAKLVELLFNVEGKVSFEHMREVIKTDSKARRGLFVLIVKFLCFELWDGDHQTVKHLLCTAGWPLVKNRGAGFYQHQFFTLLPQFLSLQWFHVLLEEIPLLTMLWSRSLEIRRMKCRNRNWKYRIKPTDTRYAQYTHAFACLRHSASISRTVLHSIFVKRKKKLNQLSPPCGGIFPHDVFCLVLDFLMLGTEFGDAKHFRRKLRFPSRS